MEKTFQPQLACNPFSINKKLDRHTASRRLHEAVIHASRAAQAYNDGGREGPAPVTAIRAAAGIGKSTAVLAEVKKLTAENPAIRILYAVPSLDLAEELGAKAEALGIPHRVMRGRSQPNPDGSGTMCAKAEIAETIAALGFSVSETLCRKKMPDGQTVECPFASSCAYLAQIEAAKSGGLLIAAHQYLSIRMDALKDIDWLIIDETFWATLSRRKRLDIGRFTTPRTVGSLFKGKRGEGTNQFAERQQEANGEIGQAITSFRVVLDRAQREGRHPTLADFRLEGFDSENCSYFAGLEYSMIDKPEINPGQSFEKQKELLQKATVIEAFGNARVWKILAAELATEREGQPHGLVVKYGALNPKTNSLENVIDLYWSNDPRFKETPTLIIDADADELITKRFYPDASIIEIDAAWQNVEITPIYDKTGSAQSLKRTRRRDEIWNAALDMADRLSAIIGGDPARRPLLITQKHVEDFYIENGDLPAEGTEERQRFPFDVAHFGALRGKDRWKECAGIIVAGRIEPSPHELESCARSLWFGSAEPLVFIQPGPDERYCLPKREEWIEPKEGPARQVMVSYHPDPRTDRVLRQIREAELMQAIARVRPIHRGADIPCQIIVLSNVPLPGIQPDRLAAWAEIVPDRFDMMRLSGFVPDVSSDIAAAYPEAFASAAAARQAASRRTARVFECDISHNEFLYRNCHSESVWIRAEYSREGNRRTGWLRLAPGDTPARAVARLRGWLPDATSVEVSFPLPTHPEAAERLPDAVDLMAFPIVAADDPRLTAEFSADVDAPWWTMTPIRWKKSVDRGRPCLT